MCFFGIFTLFIDDLLVKLAKTSYNDLRNIYVRIDDSKEIIVLRNIIIENSELIYEYR